MPKKKVKSIREESSEQHRFEVLLEEIRGELKLVSEAYSASVERDQRLEARIDRMQRDFFNFVKNIHGELSEQIQGVGTRLEERIQGVETRLEGRIQDVETRLKIQIQEVEQNLKIEIQEVKEILRIHENRVSALEKV